jgi:hypothetical protein
VLTPSPSLAAARQPSRRRAEPQEPVREAVLIWSLESLLRWGLTIVAAGVVLVGSWFNASGKNDWNDQVTAVDIAIIAVVVASASSIGLLINGRRRIGLRREALLGDPGTSAAAPAAVVADIPTQRSSSALVGGPGLLHFHRADCSMAVGRGWPEASAAEHARDGRSACGVCRP